MELIHTDAVFQVPQGTQPNYEASNPLLNLMSIIEGFGLAAEREFYLQRSLQYLVPFDFLELYGPSGGDFQNLDPATQDRQGRLPEAEPQAVPHHRYDVRAGWVSTSVWTGPFLKISYRGGPTRRSRRRPTISSGPRSGAGCGFSHGSRARRWCCRTTRLPIATRSSYGAIRAAICGRSSMPRGRRPSTRVSSWRARTWSRQHHGFRARRPR